MATLTVRLPSRMKEKVVRISNGRTGKWVREQIEKAREPHA
jgi:predicted DNA-binding protein